jgi:multimeric flavodoxin WrbA
MIIATILGSPRKHGNTAAVLSTFERLVTPQHTVRRVNIVDHTVRGCLGCDKCQRVLDEPGCGQRDDFRSIFSILVEADVVVYAAPVYVWSFPAQMKALLDRHYCLTKWREGEVLVSLLESKRTALLVTCGGDAESNADLIQAMFDREMLAARCLPIGKYVVAKCTTPAEVRAQAGEIALAMARDIASG